MSACAYDLPAFPSPTNYSKEGIDIRAYIATALLQGLLTHCYPQKPPEFLVTEAVKCADILIKELNK
jgi:hypothetical protein